MALSLSDLLAELDLYHERVPLNLLTERLRELDISLDDVHEYVHFDPKRYRRNLMHEGPGYQALILCWRSGQRSPIHDHEGSSCGVRILEGVATETNFAQTVDGWIYATGSRHLQCGEICGSQDSDIHQMSNLQGHGQNLVTLHIYSPPLLVMGTYSLTGTVREEFRDPVHSFADGAGI